MDGYYIVVIIFYLNIHWFYLLQPQKNFAGTADEVLLSKMSSFFGDFE